MKKKICTLILAVAMSICVLTGCSLFTVDQGVYYKQVVLEAGDYVFYKSDLINAYNTYGYQYTQQSSSLESGVKQTVDSLLERRLILDEIKALKDDAGNPIINITEGDKNAIRKECFEYMQESINSIETQVRKEWDIDIPNDGKEESADEKTTKKAYEPTVVYNAETKKFERVLDKVTEESNVPMHFTQTITDEAVSREAMSRYVKNLQDKAKNEGRATDKASVILHEENRVIDLLTQNKYLAKFEYYYMSNLPVNTDAVLTKFKQEFERQKTLYDADESAYHTAMASDSRSYVYYNPNSGNEYINVNHILIKFTDAEKSALQAIKNKNLEKAVEDAEIAKFYNTVKRTVTIDGVERTMNATEILEYVNNYMSGATLRERARQFDDLVYIFNEDTGNMNAEFDYVVNLDTSVKDKMVAEFANASRDLNNYGAGSITSNYHYDEDGDYVRATNGKGDYVVTEYGLHIIFHAGKVENIVNSANDITIERLLNTYTRATEEKSLFHYIYDSLTLDKNAYDNRTNTMLQNAKTKLANANITIKYYEKNYKDLWEN